MLYKSAEQTIFRLGKEYGAHCLQKTSFKHFDQMYCASF